MYLSRNWKDRNDSETSFVVVRHEDSPSDDETIELTIVEASQSTDSTFLFMRSKLVKHYASIVK